MQSISITYITDSPTCKLNQKLHYGVGIGERTDVICTVDSYPPPLGFRWIFNSSLPDEDINGVDIPKSHHTFSGSSSSLKFVVRTKIDYGSLQCSAANDIGLMKEPCVIYITPAGTMLIAIVSHVNILIIFPSILTLERTTVYLQTNIFFFYTK